MNIAYIEASHCGSKHIENQDCTLTRTLSAKPFTGIGAVADGVSASAFGGSVARWLLEQRLSRDEVLDPESPTLWQSIGVYLLRLVESFDEEFRDIPAMLESAACLSLAVVRQTEAHVFWLGDCPIYGTQVIDDRYVTRLISKPDVLPNGKTLTDWFGTLSPFQVKHVPLAPTTRLITICSDGVNCDEALLNHLYSSQGFVQAVADDLVEQSTSQPNSDDASLVAIRLPCENNREHRRE